ncbi:MAG TPA: glycosyltransferase family 39 protein [Polyangia bacterium]|nr:glycosyltransferase family 39 protein [Polyangia bacterium]
MAKAGAARIDGLRLANAVGGPLAVALVTFVLRAPSFVYPIMDIDEGSYAAIGCRMLSGGLPYRDGVENKFPAIFYVYTAVFRLFGRYDMRAVHVVAALAALGTALVAGAIAATLVRQRNSDDTAARRAGWLAALLYAVFSTTYQSKVLAANTELFAVLPGSLAMLVHVRGRNRPGALLATGALGACALLFKQVAGLLLVALAADLLIRGFRRKELGRSVADATLIGVGVIAVAGLVAVVFWRQGILADAVFWSWTYVFHHYIPAAAASGGFVVRLFKCFLPFALAMSPLLFLGRRVPWRGEALVVWLWLAAMIGAALIGGRMYGHYFLLTVPPLSVLAGVGGVEWLATASHRQRRRLAALVTAMASGFLVAAWLFRGATDSWLTLQPDYRRASAYVRERTQPDDQLFVWGWFPALYVDADRCPASRFVYTHLLTGSRAQSGAATRGHLVPEAWPMLMADLARARPAYILDTSPGRYDYPFPPEQYPPLARLLSSAYVLEAEVEGIRLFKRKSPGAQLAR